MSVIGDRVGCLQAWMDGYNRFPPSVVQFSLESGECESACVIKMLDEQVRKHFSSRCEKGVYVWFWPDSDDGGLWPLYVGKSQRGRSSFTARMKAHFRHALRGVDSLYARRNCVGEVGFHQTHKAGSEPMDDHSYRLYQQFNGMRVLFLPMNEADARELAGKAEALILAAVLKWHEEREPEGEGGSSWDWVMNSQGRTLKFTESELLIRNAMRALERWFSLAPMQDAIDAH